MGDGVTITIEGTAQIDAAIKRLYGLGARKRDMSKIFKDNMQPLIAAGKAQAPKGNYKTTGKQRLTSRAHKSGTLKRSIKFKVSKKFKSVYYVLAGGSNSPGTNAWYAHMVARGTKRGITANLFMDRAWDSLGNSILSGIEKDLWQLGDKLWRG
jgi:hypothetical protein